MGRLIVPFLGLFMYQMVIATAGSLKDIEHVIIFMQENRSWNSVGSVLDKLASYS
jgi:phospholipase C